MIIGGAGIQNYDVIRSCLHSDDFIICCDSGLKHQKALSVTPDLIIGDFDSHEDPQLSVETITLPRIKDDTDTMAAVRESVRRGFQDFLLIGIIGERLDHTLANLYMLLWLDAHGKKAAALDDYSEIEVVSREPVNVSDRFPYFSILNIDGTAHGITIKNAKYTLDNAEIPCEYQFGVSNEPLPGKEAEISLREGRILLIKDR